MSSSNNHDFIPGQFFDASPHLLAHIFLKKPIDIFLFGYYIVHTMNELANDTIEVSVHQLQQFQELIAKLFQCCQERMQYQSERFEIPDAELRCLMLFDNERYLTSGSISQKMNVVKSRISKIVDGLVKKGLVQRIKDPEDFRFSLLSLTPGGQKKLNEIKGFLEDIHYQVLKQMAPEQRKTILLNLDFLKASMESVKELMI